MAISRTVTLETRLLFGQHGAGGSSSSASAGQASAIDVMGLREDDASLLRDAQERGDRLSPIRRERAPSAPDIQRAPSHRRGHEGPTTPKAPATAPTPSRAAPRAPAKPAALLPKPAVPKREMPSVGPHDFARGVSGRMPEPSRDIATHDFARGLAPRSSIPVPPHARPAPGRGHNAVMRRGAAPPPVAGRGHNAVMRRAIAATASPNGAGFTRYIYDAARRAGIPETQARLAASQAAHESAYGRRAPGHNYFGVKGSGTAGSQMLRTHEQGRRGLYATTSRFARYAKPEDSLKHWWAKIQRQWPQAATATDFETAVKGLRAGRRGGYATDARYNEKIRRVAASLPPPSTGATPMAVAGGGTPHGPVPQTSTAGR